MNKELPNETKGVKTLLGEPKKAVIKLAIPMIIAMSVTTIYNLVDTLWVSGFGANWFSTSGVTEIGLGAVAAVGFVLPFLKELNYEIPPWDFTVKSVSSITADPHKMGLGVIPSGGFFLRDASILQITGFEIPYLAGGNFKHFHIIGTRPGGTIIAFWAIFKSLGIRGFIKIIKHEITKMMSAIMTRYK